MKVKACANHQEKWKLKLTENNDHKQKTQLGFKKIDEATNELWLSTSFVEKKPLKLFESSKMSQNLKWTHFRKAEKAEKIRPQKR